MTNETDIYYTPAQAIGMVIKEWRKNNHVTQASLAESIETLTNGRMGEWTVGQIERGEAMPTSAELRALEAVTQLNLLAYAFGDYKMMRPSMGFEAPEFKGFAEEAKRLEEIIRAFTNLPRMLDAYMQSRGLTCNEVGALIGKSGHTIQRIISRQNVTSENFILALTWLQAEFLDRAAEGEGGD